MALAMLVIAAAGCGGQERLRADFVQEADAVCGPALVRLRVLQARIDVVAAGADADAIYARTADLLRDGAGVAGAVLDRIESLEAPAEDADAIAAWLAANRRQAALTRRLAAAFDAQDQTRIARLSGAVAAAEEGNNAVARGLGMRRCAERVA